jgi:ABC-type antimicrobial peptide transport system permease subunit
MSAQMAESRFLTSLLTTFALLALLLAAVGTYATASYAMTHRLREMGIRMALGARARTLLGLLLGSAAVTMAAGIGAGTLLALFLVRFIESYVFGIGTRDPVAFLVAAIVLVAAALLASLMPALRAARVDPNRVLRAEG